MATFGSTVRRGLPRVPGGEPWPPAGAVPGPNGNGHHSAGTIAAAESVEAPAADGRFDELRRPLRSGAGGAVAGRRGPDSGR